ncbi:MAG TPA: type 4a pilus biogenesis protein PilO [Terriglobales bacterium]|jgi:Tfp pilus assembly protein PilO
MNLRRQLKLAVLVCLVADLVLIGWLLSPQAPSRAANQQQLNFARAELISLRARTAQRHRLNQQLQASERQVQALIATGFPPQSEASSKLLTEFSRIATASQVQVSGAQFQPDKDAQLGLRRVAINLQVAGGYAGVVRFINGLERSPMFFIIDQVSVSGTSATSAAGENGGQVTLQLQLEAYEQTT